MVNETNIGLNYAFLGNRLTGDIDWYYRLTQNAVVAPTLPMQEQTIAGNWGEILNMGVDININWEHHVGKNWTYFIGGNVSWLHNRVMSLRDGVNMIKGGKTVQKVGEKMNSYYGFKVIGVYQTEEECASDPVAVANGLVPGDFKYEDVKLSMKPTSKSSVRISPIGPMASISVSAIKDLTSPWFYPVKRADRYGTASVLSVMPAIRITSTSTSITSAGMEKVHPIAIPLRRV